MSNVPLSSDDSDELFVRDAYIDVLRRVPDPDGAGYFVGLLADGVSRAEVRAQLEASDEALSPDILDRTFSGEMVNDRRNSSYDDMTAAVIARALRPDSVAVDVGAHVGDVLAQIVAAAPDAAHFAVEPIPELAAILRRRFPRVSVHEVALSETKGSSTFQHVTTNPAYSGLRRRRYDRDDEMITEITVATERLDAIVGDADVAFVKIDVEGAEMHVLRGATGLLERCRPIIVFEHGLGAADHYGSGPDDVWGLLEPFGYSVSLLEQWLQGGLSLTRDEFVNEFETNKNYYFIAHADDRP